MLYVCKTKTRSRKCLLMLNMCKFNMPSLMAGASAPDLNWQKPDLVLDLEQTFFHGCIMTLGRAFSLNCAA